MSSYLGRSKISHINVFAQKIGNDLWLFPILLLATNGANTVVILRIGCAASAVRRCHPRSAGFSPAVGLSPDQAKVDGGTTACTAVVGLPAPLPSFPEGFLRTAPPVHPGILPGCGEKNRTLCPGGGIPCTHIPPGGCRSSNGSSAQRADRSFRR